MSNEDAEVGLGVVTRMARLLSAVNPDMTVRSVWLLCAVARDPGNTVSYYTKLLDMPLSTTSRLLLDLSETTRSKTRGEGANLLVRAQNRLNFREVLYSPAPSLMAMFKAAGKVPTKAK